MKKIFILMAAMLLSVGAFAQSENNGTPLKGDVNGDGTVDVADIAAIIQIMKNGGGTAETTKYYWYVGQTDPSTMSSITPIVTDNTSPGWRLIGTTLPTYSSSNRLWSNAINGDINMTDLSNIYIAIPNTTTIPRDGLGGSNLDNGSYEKLPNTKTIDRVEYTIYKSTSQWLMAFTDEIY